MTLAGASYRGVGLPDCITGAQAAAARNDHEFSNFSPGLAMLSSHHETQYSRLFRS